MEISSFEKLLSDNGTLWFKSVELTPRLEGNLQIIKGRGHVVLQSDNEFRFEVELNEAYSPTNCLGTVFETKLPNFGNFFEDNENYDFRGEDFDGVYWISENIILNDILAFPMFFHKKISFSSRVLLANTVLNSSSNQLMISVRTFHGQNWSRLLDACRTINVGQHGIVSVKFGILNDVVMVECVSETLIEDQFEDRLISGLSFIMDETLDPRATYLQTDKSFRVTFSALRKQTEDAMPIVAFDPAHSDYHLLVRNMLTKYIKFEMNNFGQDDVDYSRVTYLLRILRGTSNLTLDANIVIACIVAEGLLDTIEFCDQRNGHDTDSNAKPLNDVVISARNKVIDFIHNMPNDDSVKRRLKGALERVGTLSERDKFLHLISAGKIAEENYAAWKELRHKYIHLKENSLASKDNIRERYYNYLKVVHLIRQIILSMIGYVGPYTAYGDGIYRARLPIEKVEY